MKRLPDQIRRNVRNPVTDPGGVARRPSVSVRCPRGGVPSPWYAWRCCSRCRRLAGCQGGSWRIRRREKSLAGVPVFVHGGDRRLRVQCPPRCFCRGGGTVRHPGGSGETGVRFTEAQEIRGPVPVVQLGTSTAPCRTPPGQERSLSTGTTALGIGFGLSPRGYGGVNSGCGQHHCPL